MPQYIEPTAGFPAKAWFSLQQKGIVLSTLIYVTHLCLSALLCNIATPQG